MPPFFSPLRSFAANPAERSTAPTSSDRIAAYRTTRSASVRELAGLNGDIFAVCRISSE